jgi:DNA helicase II / ATP-dependent DNA helicase PcrA
LVYIGQPASTPCSEQIEVFMHTPASKTYVLKPAPESAAPDFTIDYQGELNPQQYKAVTTTEGPVLCIAGAGSGKTRTLIYRVAYLIEKGVRPEQILLLTFTRKAAQEMMRRASTILDDRCRAIKGGTFHGFANMTLRRFAGLAGLEPNFTILDRGDAEDLLNLLRTELGLPDSKSRFPKKRTLLEIFSKSVNTGSSIESVISSDYPDYFEESSTITRLYDSFQKLKRERAVLDYDDLLVELKLLLTCNNELCLRLSHEYQYIMIDEFQDTNHLQAEISRLLATSHHNILAVGDDAQSVYSFRGAEFRNIMDFPENYPGCEIISLEQNYRSTQPVLEFANAILDSAKEKYPKHLFSNMESIQKPVLLRPDSVHQQASFISQRILELREEGIDLNRIAVLFRAAWHSNELEVELNHCNIPFMKFGGIKFIEAAHVKDIISFLRVCINHRDATAWYRILLLHEGIGPKTAQDITSKLVAGTPEMETLSTIKKKKYSPLLLSLKETIDTAKNFIDRPLQAVDTVKQYYLPILKTKHDDYKKRIDDLHSLARLSERHKRLDSFLDDLSLEVPDTKALQEEDETSKEDEFLTLSTIHSAKGLEWHSVFILNLVDGYIPSSRALGSEKELEEERRLLYVACTRAEANLYLSCPVQGRSWGYTPPGGGYSFSQPSRFLSEIPDLSRLIECWNLEESDNCW